MPRSKRFELLSQRPVNKDSCIHEWPEKGLVNMESPFDPLPGLKIVNGIVKEMDGKKQKDFDLIDHFIVKYALINLFIIVLTSGYRYVRLAA